MVISSHLCTHDLRRTINAHEVAPSNKDHLPKVRHYRHIECKQLTGTDVVPNSRASRVCTSLEAS